MFFKRRAASGNAASNVLDGVLRKLARGQLFAISLNENREFTQNDGSAESMQEWLDANARETASDEPRQLFCFGTEGRQIYPVFTSSREVQEWVSENPLSRSGFTAVTLLEFEAPKLFHHFADAPPSVIIVINPMSKSERILTHDEVQVLARL